MMQYKEYASVGEQVAFETLENGLMLYVVPKNGFSKSFAFFATNYGGADRRFQLGNKWTDTPAGVAHFLEHKMFDMKDYDALMKLTENGARANAFTSGNMTAYHFECTDNFYESFRLLMEFVSTPYFTKASVDKEQGIIGQEIRMTEDEPDYALYYGLLKLLYKNNPIRDSVAGTVESISHITPETLYNCHKVFYAPSNMAVCVVGNVDPEKVSAIAKEVLPREKREIPRRDYGTEGPLPENKRTECEMAVGMPMFLMGARCGGAVRGQELLKEQLTANLAMSLMMAKGADLYMDLYHAGMINDTFSYAFETGAGTSYLLFGGESEKSDVVCARILEKAADIAEHGPDGALLARRKKAMIGDKLRELNVFDTVCYNILDGYFHGYDSMGELKVLSGITEGDVKSFLRENFQPEKMALSIVNVKK